MRLYHTGLDIIKVPDLDRGRRNADFGPGFYLSPDGEFSRRWARERSGVSTYVNEYELDLPDAYEYVETDYDAHQKRIMDIYVK